ncbi:putative glycosyltransferase [Cavenderia fasciculata]|uniref:Glycosyltransferase n=1 Tax=Cavenderia fasciculata TaxID=261658 RepID=F4PNS2_CACFS|nr:putative glycosyltransferase [Cavenderia fasciculata]EGG23125.1 putative glycosyltransferase [Cavenderia fasciculata]|eukprot:XP_004360976.1 putative glycosyltransferase [Cavenderia fasciculata]
MWKQSSNQNQKPYSKIFWPIRCNNKKSGYLIGWNTRSFVACVVDIISDISLKDLETILHKLSFDVRMQSCPVDPPRILGEWVAGDDVPTPVPNNLHELDIWISMKQSDRGDPILKKIYCNEYKFQTSSQIVLYDDSSPYYYTSVPISFTHTLSGKDAPAGIGGSGGGGQSSSAKSKTAAAGNSVFFIPTAANSPSAGSTPSSTSPEYARKSRTHSDLESTFKQINCSSDILPILNDTIKKHYSKKSNTTNSNNNGVGGNQPNTMMMDKGGKEGKSLFSSSFFSLRLRSNTKNKNNNVASDSDPEDPSGNITKSGSIPVSTKATTTTTTTTKPKQEKTKSTRHIFFSPLYLLILLVQLFGKLLSKILNLEAPFFKGSKLKDLTTLGTHLDNRIEEIKLMSLQYHYLQEKKYWLNNNNDRSLYIEFHNKCWLLFNDIMLGVGAGFLLNFLSPYVLSGVARVNYFLTNELLKNLILWLMGWPAGFKLNENLDKFFGRLILYYIDKWNLITTTLSPHGSIILQIVCMSGIFGVSFLISVIIDLFSIFTLHIHVFYSVSARFYLLQLILAKSLWNLFRGVKFNPLRKRTDSCDFDQYQLLLGTVLFTLIIFLVPTTAIYYYFFAVFKAALAIILGLFGLLLHLLKTFPLCGIVIYLIDPKYLPFGVTFKVSESSNSTSQQPQLLSHPSTPPISPFTVSTPGLTIQKPTMVNGNQSPPLSPTLFSTPIHHQRNFSSPTVANALLLQQQQLQQQQQQQQSSTEPNSGLLSPLQSTFAPTGTNSASLVGANNKPHHNMGHRRNQSLQTTLHGTGGTIGGGGGVSSSPMGIRVSTQLEITYVRINIEPVGLGSLFSHTSKLLADSFSFYNPNKLCKSFIFGTPINKK